MEPRIEKSSGTMILENFYQATQEEAVEVARMILAVKGLELDKAIRTPSGESLDTEEFEEWFLKELYARAKKRFVSARDHIWQIVEDFIRQKGGVFSSLTAEEMLELEETLFEAGLAHTSYMIGVAPRQEIQKRLRRIGWSEKEVLDFPGWAYRFALIKVLIDQKKITDFEELLRLARAHPISEAERQAMAIARASALNALRPVFDMAGRLMTGELLRREQELLRQLVVQALAERKHPLALAREIAKMERAQGIIRDFERIARTEIASAFSQGSFKANRLSGKFQDGDYVFRRTRPQACKICIALYTNPDGTPKLYKVKDLENGTVKKIDVGVRKQRLYQATIGATHPNELCSPWQKYDVGISDMVFERFAAPFIQAREKYNLEVKPKKAA